MIFDIYDISFGTVLFVIIIFLVIFFVAMKKMLIVVPFNEVHVLSTGKKVKTFDGKGRYFWFSMIQGRMVIPKHVLDIEPGLLELHDCDNLPFGVEISIKVQVTDPEKSAATLTQINHQTVSKVVEDTVMPAARSIAMERTILEIMRQREEIENDVYGMVASSLAKLGLSAIIFDIKNITDIEGGDVIHSLERAKISELNRDARIAESGNVSQARVFEVEQEKVAKVKEEMMKLEEESAQLRREEEIEKAKRRLEIVRLEKEKAKAKLRAETLRLEKLEQAHSEAEAIKIRSQAEADAIRLKAEAEAAGVRERGYAEADILMKKNEALKTGDKALKLQMLELLSQAQVATAGKIAEALGSNNKIMYLPSDDGAGILSSFIPKLDGILESGILDNFLSSFGKKDKK